MGELAIKVRAVSANVARIQGLKEAEHAASVLRDRLDQLKPLAQRLEDRAAIAMALSVRNDTLAAKISDTRLMTSEVLATISKSEMSPQTPARLQQIKDNSDALIGDFRSACAAAWIKYKELHVTSGVVALLETAEKLGHIKDADLVRTRLEQALQWAEPPTGDAVQATRDAISKYKVIRAELSGGDEVLEAFIIAVTGSGVTLQQLDDSPTGKQWLEANNMLDKLFVVMKKG